MNAEWRQCLLGDVLTLKRGYDLPNRDRRDGSVPIVSSSGTSGYHAEAKVKGPGVITGRYGTLGEVFYVDQDFWPLNTTLYVRDFKGNNPRFLSYFLSTLNLARQNTAGAVPGLNRNALHLLPVSIPSVETQRMIAGILSAYDDLIENNKRRIAILEEMARALYREWFVDFRFPGHDGVRMVESEVGLIPEGWEVKRLRDVSLNFDSRRKPLSSLQRAQMPGQYPYYGAAKIFDYIDSFIFEGRYLLVAEDGSVITSAGNPVLQLTNGRFWVNNHTHVIRGKHPVSTEFLYLMLSDFDTASYITGAAQPKITQAALNRIPVVIPDRGLLDRFNAVAADWIDCVDSMQRANQNLRCTRDLLLPKLVSGEVDVGHPELEVKATP